MVFLTLRLMKFAPPHDRTWRKEMHRRLSWHFYGRRRNCNALSKTPIRRSLRAATMARAPRRKHINNIFSTRIAAGCAEHGIQYSSFMRSLRESNIALDRKILSFLAVYEPRSFQSLCEFVKKKHTENVQAGLAAASKPTPSGVITRDMIERGARK